MQELRIYLENLIRFTEKNRLKFVPKVRIELS